MKWSRMISWARAWSNPAWGWSHSRPHGFVAATIYPPSAASSRLNWLFGSLNYTNYSLQCKKITELIISPIFTVIPIIDVYFSISLNHENGIHKPENRVGWRPATDIIYGVQPHNGSAKTKIAGSGPTVGPFFIEDHEYRFMSNSVKIVNVLINHQRTLQLLEWNHSRFCNWNWSATSSC